MSQSSIISKSKSLLSRLAYKARGVIDAIRTPMPEEEEEEDESLVLTPVKEFMEKYIGVFIVGFTSFEDENEDIFLEESIRSKMIVGVEVDGESVVLSLSKLNGKPGGVLRLVPTDGGLFTERTSDDEPHWASKYRITFVGNDALEYVDSNAMGSVSYSADN